MFYLYFKLIVLILSVIAACCVIFMPKKIYITVPQEKNPSTLREETKDRLRKVQTTLHDIRLTTTFPDQQNNALLDQIISNLNHIYNHL
jgi:hypothetical protein